MTERRVCVCVCVVLGPELGAGRPLRAPQSRPRRGGGEGGQDGVRLALDNSL